MEIFVDLFLQANQVSHLPRDEGRGECVFAGNVGGINLGVLQAHLVLRNLER